ncbi:MAG: hypothetical protein Tsb0021_15700 [Chlamydiales bacterium]
MQVTNLVPLSDHFQIFEDKSQLVDKIAKITKIVRDGLSLPKGASLDQVQPNLFLYREKEFRCFSVAEEKQSSIDFEQLKKFIAEELIIEKPKVLQIIGSSEPFSEKGTQFSKEFLSKKLADRSTIVLYGFTAHRKDNKRCVNGIVNDWVDENPQERSMRTIANIVNFHTRQALDLWNCDASLHVRIHYLVFGKGDSKENGGATFGKDVESSDRLTDEAICFEGGIQSLRQAINILGENNPVTFVDGLRENKFLNVSEGVFLENSLKMREKLAFSRRDELLKLSNNQVPMVSCSTFFLYLNENKENLDETKAAQLWDDFFSVYFPGSPAKKDFFTKEQLLKDAKEDFFKKKIWEKLPLCTFYIF